MLRGVQYETIPLHLRFDRSTFKNFFDLLLYFTSEFFELFKNFKFVSHILIHTMTDHRKGNKVETTLFISTSHELHTSNVYKDKYLNDPFPLVP